MRLLKRINNSSSQEPFCGLDEISGKPISLIIKDSEVKCLSGAGKHCLYKEGNNCNWRITSQNYEQYSFLEKYPEEIISPEINSKIIRNSY